MIKFLCFGSGSSGNCYWLGNEQGAILIDAGINFRTIHKVMIERGIDKIPVRALFITHDHTDHIRAASMISTTMGCPVYTTRQVHEGMEGNYGLQKKVSRASQRNLEREEEYEVPLTQFRITAFPVPHDSHDNVGYYITWGSGEQQIRFCLVTDCGFVTPEVRKYLALADHVVVESNHDVDMLMNGSYPFYLKKRVRGEGGHLSNDECADLLKDVWHDRMKHIFLCHLSADNNTADKAYKTSERALQQAGAIVGYGGVHLCSLPRTEPTQIYELVGQGESPSQPRERRIPEQLLIDFGE